ncbi:hypothetical protein TWF694_011924 [Orbilia ellipsospora]
MRITLRLDGQRRTSLSSSSIRQGNSRNQINTMRLPSVARKRATVRSADERPRPRISAPSNRKNKDSKSGSSYVQQALPESSSESDWDDPPNPPLSISENDRKSSVTHCFSEDGRRLPWFELQPLELAVLRKRMKKNSSWQPSDAMMLKQLEMLGRGVRGFRKWARRTGKSKAEVERILEGGDNSTGGLAIGALKRSQDNKGMRLNVMKRAKREREKAEAAAAAAAHGPEGAHAPSDTVDNSRSESTPRPRSSIRRSSIQTTTIGPDEMPFGKHMLSNNNNGTEYISRKSLSQSDVTTPPEKSEVRQSQNSRKLRKQQATEVASLDSEFGDAGDDMPIDPNEPTYCLCNRISFGTMVGCDNEDCPKEWFHMECVGLTAEPPKTVKWYCPLCRDDPNPSRRDNSQKTGRKKRKLGR